MSTASKTAERKNKHPEWYCRVKGCLWFTGYSKACAKHGCEHCTRTEKGEQSCCPFHFPVEAPYLAQAKHIAQMYNATARAEARPDLEE
jgi:hypothetical protein